MSEKTLKEKTAEAMARLDAREDPPDVKGQIDGEIETDVRIQVTVVVHEDGKLGRAIHFTRGSDGAAIDTGVGLGKLFSMAAHFGTFLPGMDPKLRQRCKQLGERIAEMQRSGPPPTQAPPPQGEPGPGPGVVH